MQNKNENQDFWWRCDIRRYVVYDEYDDFSCSYSQIVWTPYIFVRATAKGVFVKGYFGGEHFILGKAKRQLAVPTKALALQDCIARKDRHVAGCRARLKRAEDERRYLEYEKGKLQI